MSNAVKTLFLFFGALTLATSAFAQKSKTNNKPKVESRIGQQAADAELTKYFSKIKNERSFNKRKAHFVELQDKISALSDALMAVDAEKETKESGDEINLKPIDSTYKVALFDSYISIVKIKTIKDCGRMEDKIKVSNPPLDKKESKDEATVLTNLAIEVVKSVCKVN